MRTLTLLVFTSFLLLFTIVSCRKDISGDGNSKGETPLASSTHSTAVSETTNTTACMEDFDDGMGYDTILKPTVLGYRLTNHPYSLANMQQAYLHLYGSDDGVALTHKYVRFKPSSPQQLSVLEDLDIDLFDYPLDYDVEQEGDYYDDGITPAEEIPWLYAVVDLGFAPQRV